MSDEQNLDEIRLAYKSHADMQWVLARLDASEAARAALVEAGDRMAEALLMTEYDVESGTTRRGEMEDSRIAWEALARPGDRREDDR